MNSKAELHSIVVLFFVLLGVFTLGVAAIENVSMNATNNGSGVNETIQIILGQEPPQSVGFSVGEDPLSISPVEPASDSLSIGDPVEEEPAEVPIETPEEESDGGSETPPDEGEETSEESQEETQEEQTETPTGGVVVNPISPPSEAPDLTTPDPVEEPEEVPTEVPEQESEEPIEEITEEEEAIEEDIQEEIEEELVEEITPEVIEEQEEAVEPNQTIELIGGNASNVTAFGEIGIGEVVDPINNSLVDGIITYTGSGDNFPSYRIWNATTSDFTTEGTAGDVGGDPQWHALRANHEHAQFHLTTGKDGSGSDTSFQTYFAANDSWHIIVQDLGGSSTTGAFKFKTHDVAVEDISGDVLIVSDDRVDQVLNYSIWNGSEISDPIEVNMSYNIGGDTTQYAYWVELVERPGTDEIMLIATGDSGSSTPGTPRQLVTILWNGTHFDESTRVNHTEGMDGLETRGFDFAWEIESGAGILTYSDGGVLFIRERTPAGSWSTAHTINAAPGTFNSVRLCSDPTSDYIGIFPRVNTSASIGYAMSLMWNGTDILGGQPANETSVEISPDGNGQTANVDCGWYNSTDALFGFIDNGQLGIDYFTFSKPNTWGTSSLLETNTTHPFAADDITFLKYVVHPTKQQIIAYAGDDNARLTAHLWNVTYWVNTTINELGDSTNGRTAPFGFDWNRYDTAPSLTSIAANDSSFPAGETVSITTTAIDNVEVDTVFANITLPNTTVLTETFTNTGDDYNLTFTDTTGEGIYIVTVFANDTSFHDNINDTESSITFSTDETNPVVDELAVNATPITSGETINFTVNVTDNALVETVLINVTVPGATEFDQQILTNISPSPSLFNITFTNTSAVGDYTIRVIANDTSGNINDTETIEFTVNAAPLATMSLIVYAQSGINTPRYRLWNDSTKNFESELSAQDVGANPRAMRLRASHQRPEFILVNNDQSFDTNVQIFNITQGVWWSQVELTDGAGANNHRNFDVAYEDVSGDALIAFEDHQNTPDQIIKYGIWNGSAYSSEQTLNLSYTDLSETAWIVLVPKKGTDEIMLVASAFNGSQNIQGQAEVVSILWNGTHFDPDTLFSHSEAAVDTRSENIAFEWNHISGNGRIYYGEGTNLVTRTYTAATDQWSGETTGNVGNNLDDVRFCSDPTSNYIGMISQDSGNDVNVLMYDGTSQLGGNPTQETTTETAGAFTANIACAWYNSTNALFGFVDTNLLRVENFEFRKTNSWSVSSLGTAPGTVNIATDDIKQIDFVPHPTTQEIMVIAGDQVADLSAIHFDAGTFTTIDASVLEATLEQTNSHVFSFDWFRYDPEPNVTGVATNASAVDTNDLINITANVTDNTDVDTGVDTVIVNITKPSGTTVQHTMTGVGQIYNLTFSDTDEVGTYTVRILANDTSTHININDTETTTFMAGDATPPAVNNITVNDSKIPASEIINITANITDNVLFDTGIDTVLVNITIPGLSEFDQYIMTNVSGTIPEIFNLTFENTSVTGIYNITIIANDSQGNINDTEWFEFIVGDIIPPNVSDLFVNDTDIGLNEAINFTVNVTDNRDLDLGVDTVVVNITIPGVSEFDQYALTNDGIRYNLTFENTSRLGEYMIEVLATDLQGNINNTESINFSIGDTIPPAIALLEPVPVFNTSSSDLRFNFTPTDNVAATLMCNSTVDGEQNNSIAATLNNTLTSLQGFGFAQGNHSWNITCSDARGNQNTSATRVFVVDQSIVNFHSLTNEPSGAADVDPTTRIAFFANITDNITSVDTAIFQYKEANESIFANVTMTFNSSNGLYEANFTPVRNNTYDVRVVANDTVNNRGQSTTLQAAVQYERTWTRDPSSGAAVATLPGQNISLANITLNNTGDFTFNFTIGSNFVNTSFNTTFPLEIANASWEIVEVFAVSPETTQPIILEINASPDANPINLNSTITLAVTNQSFLIASFTSAPSSIVQGESGDITGQVRNIGVQTAFNGTVFITLPTDWSTTDELNITFDELNFGEEETIEISANVPVDAADGPQTIRINTTGVNGTGANLVLLNLTQGASTDITVENATTELGGRVEVATVAPSSIPSGATGGGATTSSSASDLQTGVPKDIIDTFETIQVVRGDYIVFPINVTNIYLNSTMSNTEMEIEGFLAQYMTWEPESIEKLEFNESESFIATISSPTYLEQEEYFINVTLETDVFANYTDIIYNNRTKENETQTRIVKTKLVEKRHVTLQILEEDPSIAFDKLVIAEQLRVEMLSREIPVNKVDGLIVKMRSAYNKGDFVRVDQLYNEIGDLAYNALDAHDLIAELTIKAQELKEIGYETSDLETLLALAKAAMVREDFASALFRAQQAAELRVVLEESQFFLVDFIKKNWEKILFGTIFALSSGFIIERRIFIATVQSKLDNITKKKHVLNGLRKEAQKLCFEEKKITPMTLKKRLFLYDKELRKITKQEKSLLRKRRLLITTEDVLRLLYQDKKGVEQKLMSTQTKYYVTKQSIRAEYQKEKQLYTDFIIAYEKEITFLKVLLKKEEETFDTLENHLRKLGWSGLLNATKRRDINTLVSTVADATTYSVLFARKGMKDTFFSLRDLENRKKTTLYWQVTSLYWEMKALLNILLNRRGGL